jgi:hypothetical protein
LENLSLPSGWSDGHDHRIDEQAIQPRKVSKTRKPKLTKHDSDEDDDETEAHDEYHEEEDEEEDDYEGINTMIRGAFSSPSLDLVRRINSFVC